MEEDMKNNLVKVVVFLAVVICFIQFGIYADQLSRTTLPNIVVLGTGGTIAGEGSSKTGVEYSAGKLFIGALIKSVPGLEKLANIKGEDVTEVPSQDINDKVFFELANKVNETLKDPSVDGIVITHGTDTMEESAYFLDLVIHSDKPIVFTGSMRPSTSLSPDGPINIYSSVAVASSPDSIGKGVLVVMDGKIYTAREVTKTNTTNVAAFKSLNTGPIGLVDYNHVRYYAKSTKKNTTKSQFNITKIDELSKVGIIYEEEGGSKQLIKSAMVHGDKGLVVAGVGDGNMNKQDEKALIEARNKGIQVVISSRVGSGCVQTDAEIKNTKLGFITANDLNPQKARILLRVAMTQTDSWEKIQEIFNQY
jgi:L-asparaginase